MPGRVVEWDADADQHDQQDADDPRDDPVTGQGTRHERRLPLSALESGGRRVERREPGGPRRDLRIVLVYSDGRRADADPDAWLAGDLGLRPHPPPPPRAGLPPPPPPP